MRILESEQQDQLSAAALHASLVRMMTAFVKDPTAELADIIIVVLDRLSGHPDRFQPKCDRNIYNHARNVWKTYSANIRCNKHLELSNVIH